MPNNPSSTLPYRIELVEEKSANEFYRLRLLGLETNPEAFGENALEFKLTPIDQVAQRIKRNNSLNGTIQGAYVGVTLVGVACLAATNGEKMKHRGHIWGVFVEPKFQRLGIAKALIAELIQYAKTNTAMSQLDLSVTTTNTAATRLYESSGFVRYGTDPGRIKIGEMYYDEYLMILDLR